MNDKSKRDFKSKPKRAGGNYGGTELADLRSWLTTLQIGVSPSLKVNGSHFPMAVVTVDLGQPLKQIRLTSEQSNELGQRLKRAAREVIGKDVQIRVSTDNSHGIHYAQVSG